MGLWENGTVPLLGINCLNWPKMIFSSPINCLFGEPPSRVLPPGPSRLWNPIRPWQGYIALSQIFNEFPPPLALPLFLLTSSLLQWARLRNLLEIIIVIDFLGAAWGMGEKLGGGWWVMSSSRVRGRPTVYAFSYCNTTVLYDPPPPNTPQNRWLCIISIL